MSHPRDTRNDRRAAKRHRLAGPRPARSDNPNRDPYRINYEAIRRHFYIRRAKHIHALRAAMRRSRAA